MLQKFKVFSFKSAPCSFENLMKEIDQAISNFLADGKRVIHMEVSTNIYTNGNQHIIYIVSLIYEETALSALPLLGEEFLELPVEENLPTTDVKSLIDSIRRGVSQQPKRPTIAAHNTNNVASESEEKIISNGGRYCPEF